MIKPILNELIKKIALENGFKTKTQPDNTEDLNPYVYDFARALIDQQYAIPEGYALVPIEATDQIIANVDYCGDVEVVEENREALADEFNRYNEYIQAGIKAGGVK